MATTKTYVGELIRAEIKKQQVKNGFVINKLIAAGHEMSESSFSSKLYGQREQFSEEEVAAVNDAFGTNFKF